MRAEVLALFPDMARGSFANTCRTVQTGRAARLLAAVIDETAAPRGDSPFLAPQAIGGGAEIRCERDGVLYLRVNDAPAEMDDNQGEVNVRIRQIVPD